MLYFIARHPWRCHGKLAGSNPAFQLGVSHPEDMIARAAEIGYAAPVITDECSLAGIMRVHMEPKRHKLLLIIGAEFQLVDGLKFVLLTTNRKA
jgi:error-prone DNA polymerase